MSVYRCYSEKKPKFDVESTALLDQLRGQLGIDNLEDLSILHRYDVEGISQEVFERAKGIVFSEPQVDNVCNEDLSFARVPHYMLAVEALPGQFDQRADSAAQCIQLMAGVDRPLVASATVYLFYTIEGSLSQEDQEKIKKYLINPVESREASLDKPDTLVREHATPDHVDRAEGFTAMDEPALSALLDKLGLAMDIDDLKFLQTYFRDEEKRDPTITEVRVVDTYWSDHCRHTTFSTHLDEIQIDDPDVKAA
ncbi:MAG: phosphoribosylformylglycinamidine synthase, partial [Lawsonibacter sp.]|nr:phosphoribosylformylglycinamidine synthase [Lawsonibacter sp.]